MTKLKALILVLTLLVVGLTTALIVVVVNNSNNNNTVQVDTSAKTNDKDQLGAPASSNDGTNQTVTPSAQSSVTPSQSSSENTPSTSDSRVDSKDIEPTTSGSNEESTPETTNNEPSTDVNTDEPSVGPTNNEPTTDVSTDEPSTNPGTSETPKEVVYFTITFNDYDGTKLDEIQVKEGEIPSYTKDLPHRKSEGNSYYYFLGWTPELVEAAENKTYTAQYQKNNVYVVSFTNVDSLITPQVILEGNKIKKPEDPIRTNYEFLGWEYNGEPWDFDSIVESNMELTATWNYLVYNFSITSNMSTTETISGNTAGEYVYNTEISVTTTDNNYKFIGWYINGELKVETLTYTFNMPKEDVEVEARYSNYTLTTRTNRNDAGSVTEYNEYNALSGIDYSINAKTNKGYTFVGWFDGDTIVSSNPTYNFKMPKRNVIYEARWIKVDIIKNIPTAGVIYDLSSTYRVGQNVTLSVEVTNPGFTFEGWYLNDENVSSELSINITMPDVDTVYEARWIAETYTLTVVNNAEADGVVISGVGTYNAGDVAELKATQIPDGYIIAWKNGTNTLMVNDSYLVNINKDIEITAELIEDSNVIVNNNTVFFGSYPQTLVTNEDLINNLNNNAGELPTSENSFNWTDYNYYIYGESVSYMWYIDIDYNNDGSMDYRGVYFDQFRTRDTTTRKETSNNHLYLNQRTNGYDINTVYWFKYEPIKWNILSEDDDKMLVIADLLLDSQEFYPSYSNNIFEHNGGTGYANDYQLSSIRKWLNDNFYNTAFNEYQKLFISNTTLQDSNSISDKIFLMSQSEANKYYSNSTKKMAVGTDYAKIQGLYVSTDTDYLGNSYWRLRTKFSNNNTYNVTHTGTITFGSIYYCDDGIRPVMAIKKHRYSITYELDGGVNNDNNVTTFNNNSGTITLYDPTKEGYGFVGWEYNGNIITEIDTNSLNDNITLTAIWYREEYTINIINQVEGLVVTGVESGEKYAVNTKIEITQDRDPNDIQLVLWTINGKSIISDSCSFVVKEDVEITISPLSSIKDNSEINKLYYGSYPQTLVNNMSLKNELNNLAGAKPTANNSYNWTDYGYYYNGEVVSYMWYIDIDYDNDGTNDYRGVYFTKKRPCGIAMTSTQIGTNYSTNTPYWFKYELIEWDILEKEDNQVLIISNLIIDSQNYYLDKSTTVTEHNGGTGYSNNYELSCVRIWLNDVFYNTAFNDLQKTIINENVVDNSASTTKSDTNIYTCENTNDNIFLLSYQEVVAYYGNDTDRQAQYTNYSEIQGLKKTGSYGWWWTRSPEPKSSESYPYSVTIVPYNGVFSTDSFNNVTGADTGVRPVCWISIA